LVDDAKSQCTVEQASRPVFSLTASCHRT